MLPVSAPDATGTTKNTRSLFYTFRQDDAARAPRLLLFLLSSYLNIA